MAKEWVLPCTCFPHFLRATTLINLYTILRLLSFRASPFQHSLTLPVGTVYFLQLKASLNNYTRRGDFVDSNKTVHTVISYEVGHSWQRSIKTEKVFHCTREILSTPQVVIKDKLACCV